MDDKKQIVDILAVHNLQCYLDDEWVFKVVYDKDFCDLEQVKPMLNLPLCFYGKKAFFPALPLPSNARKVANSMRQLSSHLLYWQIITKDVPNSEWNQHSHIPLNSILN